ncbi:LCP family protein [Cuneatibacter caecimuris]|uniref:LytR family transcriptional attenuator n=1 Tax=Cuneatibacter caecimuris TaxID=1796618 RepID=A0A4Q7NYN4_9FIRM|nr:LCP family protein [Cuneatibacter caecimuris]RZS92357.1 LytR family transcriptional attenuator [Cuneatibacter caecimuris]
MEEEKNTKGTENRESGKKKGHKALWITMAVILGLILVTVGIAYALLHHYHGKSNYQKDEEVSIVATIPQETQEGGSSAENQETLPEEVESSIQTEINKFDFPNGDYVYNILLIGSDRRDTSWYGNSDAMILASINKKTNKVYLTSFMRDSYANIPGFKPNKLNNAYAHGAGPLLVQTIEENYKINIDNYASVDFNSMVDIVDLVGGVTLTISDKEAEAANGMVGQMCNLRGWNASEYLFQGGGTVHMNGMQAVAYARIRYVGNSDFERTERQRKVLEQIFISAKKMNLGELNDLANEVLPLITHNITETQLISLLTSLPSVITYSTDMDRIPYDGMYSVSGEMLVPDFPATIQRLQNRIYAAE